MSALKQSPLGRKQTYISQYQVDLLFPIPRNIHREAIRVTSDLPFQGVDIWNAYEVSWLNLKGKPIVALGEFLFPCESTNIIESKSFKLYLNSFNNTHFPTQEAVEMALKQDLSIAVEAEVSVRLRVLDPISTPPVTTFHGTCLDPLDIECDTYQVSPHFLSTGPTMVSEVLFSDLLKSNCLVTGQPDWASVQITYTGRKINHEGLLKYIISYRNHNEFHEQCVERMFMDIMQHCAPEKLSIYAAYTRRGGLDINPFRSTECLAPEKMLRLLRQ